METTAISQHDASEKAEKGVNKNVSNTITKLYKLPGTIEYCIFNQRFDSSNQHVAT